MGKEENLQMKYSVKLIPEGSPNTMLNQKTGNTSAEQSPVKKSSPSLVVYVLAHLKELSLQGFRTLCLKLLILPKGGQQIWMTDFVPTVTVPQSKYTLSSV